MKDISPGQVIRKHCFECAGYDLKEVANCVVIDCEFWPCRFGTSPKTAKAKGHQVDPHELSGKEYVYDDESDLKTTYKEIPEVLWYEMKLSEIRNRYQ